MTEGRGEVEADFVLRVRRSADDSFASGLYCAESVLLAMADEMGVESELLPRIATAFCSGMGRMSGTCGALTGAMMGLGLGMGRSDPGGSVQPTYAATQRLIREFEQAFGARDCHLLLGCDLNTPEGQATFKSQKLGRRCAMYTGAAAEIAARLVAESSNYVPNAPAE